MYAKRYVYICDGCGAIEIPQAVQYGDLTDNTAMPDGWQLISGKHLCDKCQPERDELKPFRDYINGRFQGRK